MTFYPIMRQKGHLEFDWGEAKWCGGWVVGSSSWVVASSPTMKRNILID